MKRLIAVFLLLALLTGCANQEPAPSQSTAPSSEASQSSSTPESFKPSKDGVIEITEKLFIAQTNDMYLNPDDYVGKTVRYEGMHKSVVWQGEDGPEEIHYVIRYGPGCCGYDGEAGFEVTWDGEWPSEDDWVEAVGVLKKEEVAIGGFYLVVELTSLTVKEERGAEFVST